MMVIIENEEVKVFMTCLKCCDDNRGKTNQYLKWHQNF